MSEQAAEPNLDGPLDEALEELVSAEDFLNFFGVPFVPSVLQDAVRYAVYRKLLIRAYEDFVASDAQTEKVFKVFHMHEPQTTFVPIDQLLG